MSIIISQMNKGQPDQNRTGAVVAERDVARWGDASFAALLVPFFDRRYILLLLWLVLLAASVAVFPAPAESKQWSFFVAHQEAPATQGQARFPGPGQGPGQGQGLESVAARLSGMIVTFDANQVAQQNLTVDWSRLGFGSKAEALRGQLNVSAQTGGEDVPTSVTELHAAAKSWAEERAADWSGFRTAVERELLVRTGGLQGDPNAPMVDRLAAELALAEVRAWADVPPRWSVSEISSNILSSTGSGSVWKLRIFASIAAAVGLVGMSIVWSSVAAAARPRSSGGAVR